jgi:hypothetical protein
LTGQEALRAWADDRIDELNRCYGDLAVEIGGVQTRLVYALGHRQRSIRVCNHRSVIR